MPARNIGNKLTLMWLEEALLSKNDAETDLKFITNIVLVED